MVTMIEVVVEELCNSTVASTPIIRSAMGFLRMMLDRKASPAALPRNKNNTSSYWAFNMMSKEGDARILPIQICREI